MFSPSQCHFLRLPRPPLVLLGLYGMCNSNACLRLHLVFPSVPHLPCLPPTRTPVCGFRAHQVVQGGLILSSFGSLHPQRPFFQMRSDLQVPGLRAWAGAGEAVSSAPPPALGHEESCGLGPRSRASRGGFSTGRLLFCLFLFCFEVFCPLFWKVRDAPMLRAVVIFAQQLCFRRAAGGCF